MIDTGQYNKDNELYRKLVEELYEKYPDGIRLPPEYASFVEDNLMHLLIRLARYKFVSRMIKKTDRVLEVGSGAGLGSIFLGQHCAHVTGLDVKSTEVEEAKAINKRGNVDFIVGDIFESALDKKYDVVVALDVIEHMPLEQGHELVAQMSRNLEKNGMLIIGSPSIYSYEYQGALSKASHVKCYDKDELVELMEVYCGRTLAFSMNDEVVHTGHPKMAWYYFVIGMGGKS